MSETVAIEVNNLSKWYGATRAVEQVSFQVRRGEILGFLGPNGAGKTTTMKILTCFIAASEGSAKVNGHDVFEDPMGVRRSLGYLPESNPLYQDMTALEFLEFSAEMRGIPGVDRRAKIKKVVESAGLGDVLGKEIRAMSKGYRQRLGLAGAMVHEPPILVLDEPMSGLDPNQAAEIRDVIREIGKDRTVLLSTHNLAEVTQTCGRVLIIARGKIVADDTPEHLVRGAGKNVRYVVGILRKLDDATKLDPREAWTDEVRPEPVLSKLKELDGSARVEALPDDEGVLRFELNTTTAADLRPRIFHMGVANHWTLVEMRREGQNLEQIFRGLTLGDETPSTSDGDKASGGAAASDSKKAD